jgi:phthiocerol/phenolphthiocerol synthesis type-I polyketide synthase C
MLAVPTTSPIVSMSTKFSRESIQEWILNRLAADFGLDTAVIDPHSSFESYGLASRDLVMLSGDLEEWLGTSLSPVLLYEHPSLHALAAYLAGEQQNRAGAPQPAPAHPATSPRRHAAAAEPIAIIGMACRFPGADGLDTFWDLLANGRDGIREVPDGRWDQAQLERSLPGKNNELRTRWGGFLDDVGQFDAHFFGIAPREAVHVDPQQRLLLEVAWDALADAGLHASQLTGSPTGVFVGISGSEYGQAQLTDLGQINSYMGTGGALSIAANRLSYVFDWRGPSVAVDTACSSSLVAVHLACQSLRQGEATLAVAAGTNLILSPAVTVNFSEAGAMAADGRCKTFDARADGYVRSEGVGVAILKPLSQAVANGDRVYAVILGSAVNQDGRTNGLMAPNPRAQEEVLQAAYQQAGVSPGDISYVESHGTGTLLGDPIEAKALGVVLGQGRAAGSRCRLGSVKSNIGHLEAAAGIAGLIKVALALHHRQLPPSLHFQTPNPHIPFDDLPLRVQQKLEAWPQPGEKALAGVSSFGFGGSNAHAVLAAPDLTVGAGLVPAQDDAPAQEQGQPQGLPLQLLTLSARTPEALRDTAVRWRDWLSTQDDLPAWADICQTAARRRDHLEQRLALVAASAVDAAARLDAYLFDEADALFVTGSPRPDNPPRPVFVCPGQGSQWPGMARQLWHEQPVFRQSLQQTADAFRSYTDWDLEEVLFAGSLPERTDIIQPLLFAISVALADLWRLLGVMPGAVVGHSMGEVAAAYIAGALTLDDAARVICGRSRLLRQIEGRGLMAVVELPVEEAAGGRWQVASDGWPAAGNNGEPISLPEGVSVAAVNGPRSVVLSGEVEAVDALLHEFEAHNIFARRVNVDVASHSSQVDVLRDELLELLAPLRPQPAQLPIYSTVRATILNGAEMDAAYWVDNLRQPVLFATAVNQLWQDGFDTFVELSPHPVLLHAVAQGQGTMDGGRRKTDEVLLIASGRREQDEWGMILAGLGRLHVGGYPVHWDALFAQPRPPVSLPTYPWQRERFWFDSSAWLRTGLAQTALPLSAHPLLGAYVPLAADRRRHLWQGQLSLARLPYLADHRVGKRVIFPAAGYLAMVTAAISEQPGDRPFQLNNVRFIEALPLPADKPIATQLTLTNEPPDQAAFQIAALNDGPTSEWTRHASGRVTFGHDAAPNPGELTILCQRCSQEMDAAAFYDSLARRQLNYGPAFQRITALWCGEGQALAQLDALPPDNTYRLHPVLVDAALQTLVAAAPPELLAAGQTFLPVGLEQFVVNGRDLQGDVCWSYARFDAGQAAGGQQLRGDVFLLDEQGHVLAAALGLQARLLGAASQENVLGADHWFYQVAWSKQPLLPADAAPANGRWLLLARPDTPFVAPLRREMSRMGQQVILAQPGSQFNQISVDQYELHPDRPEDFQQLLAAINQTHGDCQGVIQGWGLNDGPLTPSLLAESQSLTAVATLHLIQALTAENEQNAPRLVCLTAGVMDGDSGGEGSLPASSLVGLARVVNNEHPQLTCVTVDLTAQPGPDEVAALARECLAGDGEREIALRAGKRFVARLEPLLNGTRMNTDEHGFVDVSLQVEQVGSLESLVWRPAARRQPGADEVEIGVSVVGLNFLDVLTAMGNRPDAAGQPISLGIECAGRITAVGTDVTQFAVGDEVVALAPRAFSSFVTVPAGLVAPKPPTLSLSEAATVPIAYVTAYYALNEVARLQAGERILIHSAATGAGLAAVQIARHVGAEIWATAGSEGKRDYLRSLGIERVFDSRSLDFAAQIRILTGGDDVDAVGVDVVFNSLAGDAIPAGLSLLRPRGRFLEIGKRDIYDNERLGLYQLRQNITFTAVDLAQIAAADPAYAGALLGKVVDLFAQGHLTPMPHEPFPAAAVAQAFRQMAQARHTGKIVVTMPAAVDGEQPTVDGEQPTVDGEQPTVDGEQPTVNSEQSPSHPLTPSPSLRQDGTYLISGGLGGIGLKVADYLAARGAGSVALLGRSKPSAEAEMAVTALRQTGTTVTIFQADVTDEAQMTAVFDQIRRELPPLRGIFHAAGILDDGTLQQQTAVRFNSVLAPKVQGGWLLHQLSLDAPLEHFVLFSSIAAIFGSPGQSNHAAANAFLDGLAHYRRAQGLPATSINWGAWLEVGAAVGKESAARGTAAGMAAITPEWGIAALDQLLASAPVQAVVTAVDWPRWFQHYPAAVGTPLLARFIPVGNNGRGDPRPGGAANLVARLQALDRPQERRELLQDFLRRQAAHVLRQSPAKIETHVPFGSLGFDSLMGLELKNSLERQLGLVLPVSLVWNYPTVAEMAVYIARQLGVFLDDKPDAPLVEMVADGRTAEIAELSDEEVLRMLQEKLGALDD